MCRIAVDEIFGDFEDLEAGEVHHGAENEKARNDKPEFVEENVQLETEERMEKKKKLKAAFDSEYPFIFYCLQLRYIMRSFRFTNYEV